ncbi:transporter substrate-binding domain-containing protein [Pseudoalteromonas sp. JBTF-M23]|uniref:Transporter substrate-binding domain-containing protein n=1 Tax=Pseudoalteromonas caenipelagi TaxID=2726988 RepID=A0A849V9J0_9GAMM|nr:transporter substrate-binding domain-containing protein [Pseudoalteromonas caenipelagi]NOU49303.1 transporter substrate-binding domain-containing protein [Pseudoalteromonas caenipelagi]
MVIRSLFLLVYTFFSSYGIAHSDETHLRVVTEHFPPYQFVKNGEVTSGFAYEIVKAALAKAQLHAAIEVLPWARAYEVALKYPNVIIFSIAKTDERAPLFHWLLELGRLDFHMYSSNNNKLININSMAEARKYILVAVRGSYEADKLLSLGFRLDTNLILVNDFAHAWRMVEKGRADAIYASHIPPKVKHSSLYGYKQHPTIYEHRFLHVAASLSTPPSTIAKLQRAFSQVRQAQKNQ